MRFFLRWLTKEQHDAAVAEADALPKADGYARQSVRDLDAANTHNCEHDWGPAEGSFDNYSYCTKCGLGRRLDDVANAPESERERGLPR